MTSIFTANRIALVTGASDLQSRFPSLNIAVEAADLSDPEAVHVLVRQLERAISTVTCWLTTPAWVNLNCSKDHPGEESARSSKSTLLPCSASRIIFCLR